MDVLSLPSALAETVSLLDTADKATLTSRRMTWDSMKQVLRLLRRDFRAGADNPLAERETAIASSTWAWASVCMDGPVAPNHACTGHAQLLQNMDEAIRVLEHDRSGRVSRLKQAVEKVAAHPHPAGHFLAEFIRTSDSSPAENANTVLIVRGEGRDGVLDWAAESQLNVEVVTVNQARCARPWHRAFLFGPPDRYVSSPWLTGPRASAVAGWLVSSPPARSMIVMSWSGHRVMKPEGYEPWTGAPPPRAGIGVSDDSAVDDFLPEFIDNFSPVSAPSFAAEDETVKAVEFQFSAAGRHLLAYFHPEIGPKLSLVSFDDDQVLLTRSRLTSVRPGRCFLFRISNADRGALDTATADWLRRHRKSFPTQKAQQLKNDLKDAFRETRSSIGQPALVQLFAREGLETSYARSLAVRITDPDFIAPLREADYFGVCRAVGLIPSKDAFALLKDLRTARRQAGLELSRRIADELKSIPDLPDALRDFGLADLNAPGLEGVVLIVVRSIGTEPVSVPISRLGTLVTQAGHPWHP